MKSIFRLSCFMSVCLLVACNGDNSDSNGSRDAQPAGMTAITVSAMTASSDGQGAQIQVLVDGKPALPNFAYVANTTEPVNYLFLAQEPVAENSVVDVVVVNRPSTGNQTNPDRAALQIDSLTINDTGISPYDSIFDPGDGTKAFDGEDVTNGGSEVSENGALRFLAPAFADSQTPASSGAELGKADTKWCTGKANQNLAAAKNSFKFECGEPYNDQKGHRCDYKSDGFHCNGNVAASSAGGSQSPSNPPTAGTGLSACAGSVNRDISIAKRNFASSCGRTYNDRVGDQCTWNATGWICKGSIPGTGNPNCTPLSPNSVQNAGNFKGAVVSSRSVKLTWTSAECEATANVSRNGQVIARGIKPRFLITTSPAEVPVTYGIQMIETPFAGKTLASGWKYVKPFMLTERLTNCRSTGNGTWVCTLAGNASFWPLIQRTGARSGAANDPSYAGGNVHVISPSFSSAGLTSPVSVEGLLANMLPGGSSTVMEGNVGGIWGITGIDACNKSTSGCGGGTTTGGTTTSGTTGSTSGSTSSGTTSSGTTTGTTTSGTTSGGTSGGTTGSTESCPPGSPGNPNGSTSNSTRKCI